MAGTLAVGYDIHTLREMEDEKARFWKIAGIGLGGLATILGGTALIVGSGGLLAPLVLGAAGGIASVYADRVEEDAKEGEVSSMSPARQYGSPTGVGVGGVDDTFQMFPTYEAGRAAQKALWQSKGYQEEDGKPRSIRSAVKRWAPDAPESYVDAMLNAANAGTSAGSRTKMMNEVSESELNAMMDVQQHHEGFRGISAAEPRGTRSWRNNNPGNIMWTQATRRAFNTANLGGRPIPGQGPVGSPMAAAPEAGRQTPGLFSFEHQTAGAFGNTPVSREAIANSRTTTAAAVPEEESLTPTAVVAPQTTNNYYDNRVTNFMRPALDARNREAGFVAQQNLQGLTPALG